jgi:hypothetical protein
MTISRLLSLAVVAFVLAGCSSGTSTPPSGFDTETINPSVISPTFCQLVKTHVIAHYIAKVRNGSELVPQLEQDSRALIVQIRASTGGNRPAIAKLETALGRLNLSIDRAGDSYPYDADVKLWIKDVGYVGLSAALRSVCT